MIHSIDKVSGIGPKNLKVLRDNKIFNTYSMVLNFPKTYSIFDEVEELNFSNNNTSITILGEICSPLNEFKTNKISYINFEVLFKNKILKAIAFNQSYLLKEYKENDKVYLTGKYTSKNNTIIISKIVRDNNFNNILPIYKIEGIYDKTITKIVDNIFSNNLVEIYENMPVFILNKYNLLSRIEAIKKLHKPSNKKELSSAINRMKYEEAYYFQKEFTSKINVVEKRNIIKYDLTLVKSLIDEIDFELTVDQKNAVNEIFQDFKKEEISYRLIQGDVGSGKTIVAILGAYGMITAKKQVALMAPTELLAKQHYNSIIKLLKGRARVELLTSDTKNKDKIKSDLSEGLIDFIVGTHALIVDNVRFMDLGLAIIDEQHKFGVEIRKNLLDKGLTDVLYLTATPIPRTLAISLFGESKISLIKEKPGGRKEIITKNIKDDNLEYVFEKLRDRIVKKEKTIVVVPAISSTHAKYNVENVYELINDKIKNTNIYKLSSKVAKKDQNTIINDFINKDAGILISTTMIEVGIDIELATLIVIFSADFFGLSQIHQLRGRVGRNNLDNLCLLVSTNDDVERLSIIEKVSDGFILSEHDLKLRGPGMFLGTEQSGNISFKYLDFFKDFEIINNMKKEFTK
ncbi:DEAD/DEAH box helicase [Haploplasma modicum]|uniref:DEAD/DEAH box helicase n=1 Tax=Haploplasma modicum TaxID=2150 RepID=UPI000689940C|nr:DEAD/DEAH box helicase [Haploplasma modicum]